MLDLLIGYGVYRVDEDRSSEIHGSPAVKYTVHQVGYEPHEFLFSKANHMTDEEKAHVMRSYLRNRTKVKKMKVGDTYKVYLEVAPGLFEVVGEAAIKRINKDDNKVDLVIPATLVVMDTRVEIDPTPREPQEPLGNAHILLGVDDDSISNGPVTQPVIAQDVQQAVEAASVDATSAPVGEGTPGPQQGESTISGETVQTQETQDVSVEVASVASTPDPSAPQ